MFGFYFIEKIVKSCQFELMEKEMKQGDAKWEKVAKLNKGKKTALFNCEMVKLILYDDQKLPDLS